MSQEKDSLENLLSEERTFAPSSEFSAAANGKASLYTEAESDRLAFWAKQAEELTWDKKWNQILDWQPPFAQWFVGARPRCQTGAARRHRASS